MGKTAPRNPEPRLPGFDWLKVVPLVGTRVRPLRSGAGSPRYSWHPVLRNHMGTALGALVGQSEFGSGRAGRHLNIMTPGLETCRLLPSRVIQSTPDCSDTDNHLLGYCRFTCQSGM